MILESKKKIIIKSLFPLFPHLFAMKYATGCHGYLLTDYKTSLQIKDITPVYNTAGHPIFLLTLFVMELKTKN